MLWPGSEANWQRYARYACILLPVLGCGRGLRRTLRRWVPKRAFSAASSCCGRGLGRNWQRWAPKRAFLAASSCCGRGLRRIGSVLHCMRALCCQFVLWPGSEAELAASCTVCAHSAASSRCGRGPGRNWQRFARYACVVLPVRVVAGVWGGIGSAGLRIGRSRLPILRCGVVALA